MGRRTLFRLTALQVKRLTKVGRFADGGGLYIQINAAGNKSWIFRYTFARRSREMGLGSCNAVSLDQARRLAECQRSLVAEGLDPIRVRKDKRAREALQASMAVNFREAALQCLERKKAAWRCPKHPQQWQNTLEQYVLPSLGRLSVREIEASHIVDVLEPIWTNKHETASRVRERIEAVLDFAKTRGWRDGENPARWRGHLENLLLKPTRNAVRHHPALPYKEIAVFTANLREQEGFAARALELVILTVTCSPKVPSILR